MSKRIKSNSCKFINNMSIAEFSKKRNKILILRTVGGLGDILMHRMMFEDFKNQAPDCEIHFACPKKYHDAVIDHPFIDKVLDVDNVDKKDYLISYNTSTACTRYEIMKSPMSDLHRSDIWAAHCGISLSKHDMHIKLSSEEQKWGISKVESLRKDNLPVIAVAPISAMGNKNLTNEQISILLDELKERNLCPIGIHTNPILPFSQKNIPVVYRINIREWMSVIAAVDYVVSVDTAAFHCAGGMNKPVVGIFTFCNASIYSMYYNKSKFIQGPCPAGYNGCYNWCDCPFGKSIPCASTLNIPLILSVIDNMISDRSNF